MMQLYETRKPGAPLPHAATAPPVRRGCTCGGQSKNGEECTACRERRLKRGYRGLEPSRLRHRAEASERVHHSLDRVQTFSDDQRQAKDRQQAPVRRKRILGFNINKSHCGCLQKIPAQIQWAQLAGNVYDRCGKDPNNKTGTDVENCFDAEMVKRGIKTSVAGTTSSTGVVKIKKSKGACGPIWDHATKLHEKVHANTQRQMVKKHGKNTPAFDAAWNDAKNWGADEVKAYAAEIPFYQAVTKHLQAICQKKGGGSNTGKIAGGLIGGGVGAIGGALIGAQIGAVGGPVGAAIGAALGALGGVLIGSLFD